MGDTPQTVLTTRAPAVLTKCNNFTLKMHLKDSHNHELLKHKLTMTLAWIHCIQKYPFFISSQLFHKLCTYKKKSLLQVIIKSIDQIETGHRQNSFIFIYDIQREQGCQLFGPSSSLAQFISLKKAMLRRRQPRSCLAFRPFPSPPCNSYYCII